MRPPVVTRPILPVRFSTNQSAPSAPTAIPIGPELAVGTAYSVKVWAEEAAAAKRAMKTTTERRRTGKRDIEPPVGLRRTEDRRSESYGGSGRGAAARCSR